MFTECSLNVHRAMDAGLEVEYDENDNPIVSERDMRQ
jgi:hypothetical protein